MSINLAEKQMVLTDSNNVSHEGKGKTMTNINGHEGVTLLPVFIRRSSGDVKLLVTCTSEQINPTGFRKIEPKPCIVEDLNAAGVNESEMKGKRRRKRDSSVRLLGSNATRRGVRKCVTCKGRIGYRSKKCKHCSKTPELVKSNLKRLQRKSNEDGVVSETDDRKELDKFQENKNTNIEDSGSTITSLSIPEQCITGTLEGNELVPEMLTLEDKLQDNGHSNDMELHNEGVIQVEDTTCTNQEEGSNEFQEQLCLQNEQFDQGFVLRKSCEDLGDDINKDITVSKDLQSDQDPCSNSRKTSVEKTFVTENQSIDDTATRLCISSGEGKEKPVCLSKTRSKRKYKQCSGKKKKQRKASSSVQFVRIEPKPHLEENCKDHESSVKHIDQRNPVGTRNGGKTDTVRFLSSNPTRRGIMSCPLCQKEVGCRSKTCKYCKVAINFSNSKALEHNNLLIVQLSPQTDPEFAVFSVKKTTTPSEERCFIRQTVAKDNKDCKEKTVDLYDGSSWLCECTESDHFSENAMCEHALCFFRSPRIVQARTATLIAHKIDCLPIDNSFKDKLKQLWEKNQASDLPLVQQVALNTLVVLDMEKDVSMDSNSCTGYTTCVHIRFEKVKRQSFVQPHIFCSGKSCSFWSPVENQKDSPVTCLHYCISLWAIASDNELERYFKLFLEAPQVYLHSEVFESLVSP